MTDKILDLIGAVSGVRPHHQRVITRTAWVAFVTFHILWVCGWLTVAGLSPPFAAAADLERLQARIDISARISLAQELRVQMRARCLAHDSEIRASIERLIETLQVQYVSITGDRYHDSGCTP
jgi:hypothetical protein